MNAIEAEILIQARIQTQLLLMLAYRSQPNWELWKPEVDRLHDMARIDGNEALNSYRGAKWGAK